MYKSKSIKLEKIREISHKFGKNGNSRIALIKHINALCSTKHETPLTVWVKSIVTEYHRYPHRVG